MLYLVTTVLVICVGAGAAFAQALHLPPSALPDFVSDSTAFTLTPSSDTTVALRDGASVSLRGGRLTITPPGTGATEHIALGDKTVAELSDYLRSRFSVTTRGIRPDVHTRFLKDFDSTRVSGDLRFRIHDRHSAFLTLGSVHSLRDDLTSNDNGFFGDAGFQLDLVGRTSQAARRDRLYGASATFRVGLYANEPLQIEAGSEADGVEVQPDSDLVGDTLQKADQIAIGAVFDARLFQRWSIVSVEVSQVWTALDAFDLSGFVVDGMLVNDSAEELFDSDVLEGARNRLDQTIPTFAWFFDWTVRLPASGKYAFYAGAGTGHRELIQRSVNYSTMLGMDENGAEQVQVDKRSLRADVKTVLAAAYRLRVGFNIGSVIDLRVESIAPYARRNFDPLVRVSVSKPFDLGS